MFKKIGARFCSTSAIICNIYDIVMDMSAFDLSNYSGVRDYDPMLGRWLEADPIGFESEDTNLYAYVGNDPINFIDPSGLKQEQLCRTAYTCGGDLIGGVAKGIPGTFIGAIVGAVAGGVLCPDVPEDSGKKKPDKNKKPNE